MKNEAVPTVRALPPSRREETRAQARRARAAEREASTQTSRATAELLQAALAKARQVMSNTAMIQLLYTLGIQTIPRALAPSGRLQRNGQPTGAGADLDGSLDFIIAWTFLFPLLKRPEVAAHLDTAWPGFILQMKDAFIAVVVEGPFPHAISGHRGRRHQATYHPASRGLSPPRDRPCKHTR